MSDKEYFEYFLIKDYQNNISHLFISGYIGIKFEFFDGLSYEGVWMFTYIEFI